MRVWTSTFLKIIMHPQKAPTALPQRANHMFKEAMWTILLSESKAALCQRSDQTMTGSKHQVIIAANKFSPWK